MFLLLCKIPKAVIVSYQNSYQKKSDYDCMHACCEKSYISLLSSINQTMEQENTDHLQTLSF